ncbi:hypothetical protein [Kitasatospora sp. GAS204B]|uniref:hypothetical protein n=1 Tax=unclassified Kitasatospora TaxID=2633591 RepID=UPI0024738995|nr:hypothetical protein [Kitasatospora sp. GAS204B]MDH6122078.1 hypothetical protein [Kitasatospora sp. GAS204B]
MTSQSATWEGATRRDAYRDDFLAKRDRFADAVDQGDWPTVLEALAKDGSLANARRLGGASDWTALHQTAWHPAPPEVVEELVRAGAWRTLRSADGERPLDIATRLGHDHLLPLLRPVPVHPVPEAVLQAMEPRLHTLILARAQQLAGHQDVLPPQVAVLTELAVPKLWLPVPGMHGSFNIELLPADDTAPVRLEVASASRVAGGSGQTHHITADGCTMVEDGWG